MSNNLMFDRVKALIAEGGAKTGQEIQDHLNANSPVARSLLRDMVVQGHLVHKKGLYYLQGQEGFRGRGMTMTEAMDRNDKAEGNKPDVVVVDEASPVKKERTARQIANDARKEAFEKRKKVFEENADKAKEE